MSADKMPPLPPQTCMARDTYTGEQAFGYEADDMHAYARAYAAEQTRELVEALEVARTEMVASGNWYASDFGWPKACVLVDSLIAKHKEQP
jgi:hypothetical protein